MTQQNETSMKVLIAWCLYDWACAAFPIIITTFVFATYFTTRVAANVITGTYQWASATAIAGVIIALVSPLFGAIADHSGRHKQWLLVMTVICIVSTSLLWFVLPVAQDVYYALACVVIGTIALEIAVVFYNSFLPRIAPVDYIGRLSGWAWGLGYFGGIIALSITLFVFIDAKPAWLSTETAEQIRICGPLTAIWFAFFSLPLFIFVPDSPPTRVGVRFAIQRGLSDLIRTVKTLPRQQNLFRFLLAHLIYIDGLNTLFAFGGIYAAGTFHMSFSEVILFGITMNVSAGLGAVSLAWVDDFLGSKATILISLVCMILFGIPLILLHNKIWFWCMGLLLSLFLGPVQSASRSLLVRLIPKERSTELFGLYAFSGKITAFVGPWLLGTVTYHFNSQRAGIATILVFFVVGAILMNFVREGVPVQPE